jgi:hypothetical protein
MLSKLRATWQRLWWQVRDAVWRPNTRRIPRDWAWIELDIYYSRLHYYAGRLLHAPAFRFPVLAGSGASTITKEDSDCGFVPLAIDGAAARLLGTC